MAVAAYAAVLSLIEVLDRIQHEYPLSHRLHLDRKQIEALQEKVSFLQEFLELYCSQTIGNEIQSLGLQISDVANEAEDIIDSYVVNQIRDGFPCHTGTLTLFSENIDVVIEKIDFNTVKLMKFKELMTLEKQQPGVSLPAVSTAPLYLASGKNSMVGFRERLVRIMEELMVYRSDLQILPIVGMGGIGKTTLARNVFEDPCMVHHFHVCLWVTVSQEYNLQDILFGLLLGLELDDMKKKEKGDDDLEVLGEKLYKGLSGRKYLVVIDDVWSSEVWNDLRKFFPDNKNGSRIVVTTRLSDVAASFGSNNPFLMEFLDEDQSWNLFCEKAFTRDDLCPPELEKIGRSIAKGCKGLPLAIVVIGGLLSRSNMRQQYWEFVAENVISFVNSENDEFCLKILSLSYNHLPIHLKPCFLYMRVFPEDQVIHVSELIKSWVAQGFLKPIKDRTLEEIAEEYLEDLIGRNLILRGSIFSGKTCRMHDLLRDLCTRESQKEHLHFVPKIQTLKTFSRKHYETLCFLCTCKKACTWIDLPRVVASSQQSSLASCLVCGDCRIKCPHLEKVRVVKVLDIAKDIMHPTRLRYLCIDNHKDLRFAGYWIHLLWNLQTLNIHWCDSDVHLPFEIWELPHLRHLSVLMSVLPNPPLITEVDKKGSAIILKNLQTLGNLKNFCWSEDAIERVPNLKKLEISYEGVQEWSHYSLHNLECLHKLESLGFVALCLTLKNIAFPCLLKELILSRCEIPWEEMTIIGSLPNLEVLELMNNAFKGPEWKPVEGKFLQLKTLGIVAIDLVHWEAEKFHFPKLEKLILESMDYLGEIPSGIGEIETLRSIYVEYCAESIVNSAKEIVEEQHSLGNEELQLYVDNKLVLPAI